MTLVLNGTTGVSSVDGSASTPAVQGADSNTGVFFPAADTVAIATGGSERLRADSSGNVGIGTTSPGTFSKLALQVDGTTTPTNATNVGPSSISLYAATNGGSTNSTVGIFGWQASQPGIGSGIGFSRENSSDWGSQIRFYTHPTTTSNISDLTERARIDSSGNLLVGNSTASQTMDGLFVRGKVASTGNQWNFLVYTQGGSFTLGCRDDYYLRSPAVYDRTSGGAANVFVDSSGYLYRSTSSIRYKRDVVSYDKGLETVSALRPVYYKSNVESPDGAVLDEQYAGFIAEEVAAAGLEEFVVRNDQGQPDALHYGNMVSLLTKAIQELTAKLDAAEARIAALEAA